MIAHISTYKTSGPGPRNSLTLFVKVEPYILSYRMKILDGGKTIHLTKFVSLADELFH